MDEEKNLPSNAEATPDQLSPERSSQPRRRQTWLMVLCVPLFILSAAVLVFFAAWPNIVDKAARELRVRWGLELALQDYSLDVFPIFLLKLSNVRLSKFALAEANAPGVAEPFDSASPQMVLRLGQVDFSLNWKELKNTRLVVENLSLVDVKFEMRAAPDDEGSAAATSVLSRQEESARTLEQQLDQVQKFLSQLRGLVELKNLSVKNFSFVKRNEQGDLVTSADFLGGVKFKLELGAEIPNSTKKLTNLFGYLEDFQEKPDKQLAREYQIHSSVSIDPGSALQFVLRAEPASGADKNFELHTLISAFFELKLFWSESASEPIRLAFEPIALEIKELAASVEAIEQSHVPSAPAKSASAQFSLALLNLGLRSPKPGPAAAGCSVSLIRDVDLSAVLLKLEACFFQFGLTGLRMNESAWKSLAASNDPGSLDAEFSAELGERLEFAEKSLQAFFAAPMPQITSKLIVSNNGKKLLHVDFGAAENRNTLRAALVYLVEIGELVELAERAGILSAELKQQVAEYNSALTSSQLRGQANLDLLKPAVLELLRQRNAFASQAAQSSQSELSTAALLPFLFGAHPKIDAWSVLSLARTDAVADLDFKGKNVLNGEGVSFALLAGLSQDSLESDLRAVVRLKTLKKKLPSSVDELSLSHRLRAVLSEQSQASLKPAHELPKLAREIEKVAKSSVLSLWMRRPLKELQSSVEFQAFGVSLPQVLLQEYNLGQLAHVRASAKLNLDEHSNAELEFAKVFVSSRARAAVVPLVEASLNGRLGGKLDEGFVAGRFKLDLPDKVRFEQKDHTNHLEGKLDFPFKIVYTGAEKSLLVNARAQLAGLNFTRVNTQSGGGELSVQGLSGQFPLEEQFAVLPLEGDALPFQVSWQPVLDENPFRRTGSQRLAGLYSAAKNMTLRSVSFGKWRIGPLAAALAVKQNQLIVDSLDAEVLGGVMTGQAAVSVQPSRPTFGFSGRFSQIDGAQLLGIEGLRPEDSALNARTAFVYNFKEALVEGRADIDRIPRPLLDRSLARLDPSGVDSKIAVARKALKLAAPGKMGVQMHDGFADLSLELVSLGGGSQTLRIPGLPLTRLLESKTAALRQGLETAVPELPESESQNP